jgi:hypothetical protein
MDYEIYEKWNDLIIKVYYLYLYVVHFFKLHT